MACLLPLLLGHLTLRVGSHPPLPGPSNLLRWLPCSRQRSDGALPPHPPQAPPPRPLHLLRHLHHPPAPVPATQRALAFQLSLR